MGKQSYLNAAAHGYARRSYTQLFAQVLHLRKQLFPQRTIMRKRQVKMHASSQQHTTLDSTGVLKRVCLRNQRCALGIHANACNSKYQLLVAIHQHFEVPYLGLVVPAMVHACQVFFIIMPTS